MDHEEHAPLQIKDPAYQNDDDVQNAEEAQIAHQGGGAAAEQQRNPINDQIDRIMYRAFLDMINDLDTMDWKVAYTEIDLMTNARSILENIRERERKGLLTPVEDAVWIRLTKAVRSVLGSSIDYTDRDIDEKLVNLIIQMQNKSLETIFVYHTDMDAKSLYGRLTEEQVYIQPFQIGRTESGDSISSAYNLESDDFTFLITPTDGQSIASRQVIAKNQNEKRNRHYCVSALLVAVILLIVSISTPLIVKSTEHYQYLSTDDPQDSSNMTISAYLKKKTDTALTVLDNKYGMKSIRVSPDDQYNSLYKLLLWARMNIKGFPKKMNMNVIVDVPVINACLTGSPDASVSDAYRIVSYFSSQQSHHSNNTVYIMIIVMCIVVITIVLITLVFW